MLCTKCQQREATFDAPDHWCDECWTDWWFDSSDDKEREKASFLEHLKRRDERKKKKNDL